MILQVPVIHSVDLLLCGLSPAAIRTAIELKHAGMNVFAVTAFAYPGEGGAAHYDWEGENDPDLSFFFPGGAPVTPNEYKLRLEEALIRAGVDFLYQAHPVLPVADASGSFAGMLLADRTGFQIVQAKAVLDSSMRFTAAKICGVPFNEFRPGRIRAELFLLGGAAHGAEKVPGSVRVECRPYDKFRYVSEVNLAGNTPHDFSVADTALRLAAWSPDTVCMADFARMAYSDTPKEDFTPSARTPVFFPGKTSILADFLKHSAAGKCVRVLAPDAPHSSAIDAVRMDTPCRFTECETVPFELNTLLAKDMEECDVLVAGGGTGGAPAAIAAARSGAKTICLENLSCLGGVMTAGRICSYYYGNVTGFTCEVDAGVRAMGPACKNPLLNADWKAQYFLKAAAEAGAETAFGTLVIAALKQGNRVAGAIAVSPLGLRVIRAAAVIDATGNADIAAAAGARTVMAGEKEPAVQGAGLSPIIPGNGYTNTDFLFIQDHDVVNTTAAFVTGRAKFSAQFDVIQIANTRERRRILGDITLQPQDFFAARTWSDTICAASSNFDTHGFIVHPMFMIQPPGHDAHFAEVPLRALLPKDLTGILVTGLAMSAHRDCMPLIRMQPDVQNQGYAAGLIAAMAAETGTDVRAVDIRAIQRKLVEKGNLPRRILEEVDAIPAVPPKTTHNELAAAFEDPEDAVVRYRAKLLVSNNFHDAVTLAFLGDASGTDVIRKFVENSQWDGGWNFTGMGQYGESVSPVDSALFALAYIGKTGSETLDKAKALTPDTDFSHFRAVSMAFQTMPSPDAAPVLHELLALPRMHGYATRTYEDARQSNGWIVNETLFRNYQLKEFYTAKALKACDPSDALADEILKSYRESVSGYFAMFA